jgi:AraC family transcriptional regulator
MFEVDVVEEPERRVLGIDHRGPYQEIGGAFERLGAAVEAAGLRRSVDEWLGIYFDDPSTVPADSLRSMAGVTATGANAAPAGLAEVRLPGGRYARMRVRGPYSSLPAAYEWIYGTWLPDLDERTRGSPSFEVYVNDPREVAEDSILTDVYVPLA